MKCSVCKLWTMLNRKCYECQGITHFKCGKSFRKGDFWEWKCQICFDKPVKEMKEMLEKAGWEVVVDDCGLHGSFRMPIRNRDNNVHTT